MSSYVSARFEKDELSATDQVRIIVRNLDQGNVPPEPSGTYFPTDPDELQPFIVAEFVSRITGENFVRVADLSDLDTYNELVLDILEDTSTDFVAASVAVDDTLEITLDEAEVWTSEEYPGTNPFQFTVSEVISATQIRVSLPFPVFTNPLSWSIPARSLSGSTAVTIRDTDPPNGTTFLERRFNRYFTNAVTATNFVTATKADLIALANESIGAELVSESFTAEPT